MNENMAGSTKKSNGKPQKCCYLCINDSDDCHVFDF